MLRRPDIEPDSDSGRRSSRRRALILVSAIVIVLLVTMRLSALGVLVGALAGALIILFGAGTGWVVTYVLKIPRDGRGVHERLSSLPDATFDELGNNESQRRPTTPKDNSSLEESSESS